VKHGTRSRQPTAVQFGAGNIGRGFMGQLLREAGLEIVFVDTDASLVNRLNERGSYPLRLLDAYSRAPRDLTIDGFTAFRTTQEDAIAEAVARARVAATAVGVANLDAMAPLLAKGIERRGERAGEPLDVYLCENMLGAAGMLSEKVMRLLDDPGRAWAQRNIGFVGTSVARIVGGAGTRSAQDDPLLVIADAHRDTPYDGRARRAGEPNLRDFHPVNNFRAEVERKIFTHNVGHAALAYLGYRRGHTFIHETFADDFVKSVFEGALDETSEALLRRYPADLDHREHLAICQDVRVRFSNPLLRDAIVRVAKDPIRKLGRDDRIIGAAELCLSQGIAPDHIATVCGAALCYNYADDPYAVRLQTMIRERGLGEALKRISGVEPSSDFGQKILTQYQALRAQSTPGPRS
jgi:mannitol-1-phosphate 5-dehydrogenase